MMIEKIMVRASDSIRRTMETISDGNGGIALVVDESKRLLGTISDGDIRRGLLRGLTLEDSVETIVNRNFISANESADRRYILDLMQSHQIRQMPILDKEGRPVALHLMREIIGHRARANVAVIMAGGKGERLRPITESIPKPMALVAGHPILEHILLQLIGAGIRKFYLCVN